MAKETSTKFGIFQKQEVRGRKIFSKWAYWLVSDWETSFSDEEIRSFSEIPKNTHWFSIIEILVWILIFSLWLVAIYALISSSLRLNDYNKNSIIASNLAREQLELVKNIRDTNYKTIHKWNQINPLWDYNLPSNFFQTWAYYTIENDFRPLASFPIKVEKISDFWEGASLLKTKMQAYKLCIDPSGIYTYDCSPDNKSSSFYRFIKIDEVKFMSWGTVYIQKDAYRVTSKVIWYMQGYNETQLDTIIADWKRL